MTMLTVVGIAADQLGHARHDTYSMDERGAAHRHTDLSATPADSYRCDKDRVPIEWRHNRIIGQVAHLERSHGNLWAIGEIDIDRLDGIEVGGQQIWWSPDTWDVRSRRGVDAELLALGLTPQPASNALPPVKLIAGDLELAARRSTGELAKRLTRALDARASRRTGDRIRITELDASEPSARTDHRAAAPAFVRPAGRIEYSKPYAGIISVR